MTRDPTYIRVYCIPLYIRDPPCTVRWNPADYDVKGNSGNVGRTLLTRDHLLQKENTKVRGFTNIRGKPLYQCPLTSVTPLPLDWPGGGVTDLLSGALRGAQSVGSSLVALVFL